MKILYTVLSDFFKPEVISENIVDLVESHVHKGAALSIKSVPKGTRPESVVNYILGYCPEYGFPFMSNPEKDSDLLGIDVEDRRIIYQENGTPIHKQRDCFVFHQVEGHTFIHETLGDVLFDFYSAGYQFLEFEPKMLGDNLLRYKNPTEIVATKEIDLATLF